MAQWEGLVRMEPFLGFFHQSSKSLSWPRGAVTFSPHSDRLRVLRAAVGLSSLASHLLAASPSVAGLDDSSHRLLLERSVAAALPAGPFASGIMRRAPNFWSNLFPPTQGPKASIPWARPHVRRQPSWSPSAKTEVLLLPSRRSLARKSLPPSLLTQVCRQ